MKQIIESRLQELNHNHNCELNKLNRAINDKNETAINYFVMSISDIESRINELEIIEAELENI